MIERQAFAGGQPVPTTQYQYQCQLTGMVKAYKQMTQQQAKVSNLLLESQDARGHWLEQTLTEARQACGLEPLRVA
jgi:hypothetical protein